MRHVQTWTRSLTTNKNLQHFLRMNWTAVFSDMLLDNTGSTARDHLANERTFLAWLRTALSIAAIGIAIQQLLRTSTTAQITGYIFVVLGAAFLIVATIRYFRTMTLLTQAKFETNRFSVIIIALLCVTAIAVALYAIIAT